MSLRDAAQQALEALKIAQDDCIHGEMAEPSPIFENAITALEAALAEPQPEIEQLKAERDALTAAAEKGTEYVLAHINQDLRAERDAAVAVLETVLRIPFMSDADLEQLQINCKAAIDAARGKT